MKRPLHDKFQSTKLHQTWTILFGSTALLIFGYITSEIWLGAIALASGQYTWASVQQHKIYGNDTGMGVDDP